MMGKVTTQKLLSSGPMSSNVLVIVIDAIIIIKY